MKQPTRYRAEALLVITTAIWGSTFVIIKLLLTGATGYSPFALLLMRFAIAAVASLIAFRPRQLPGKTELIGALVIAIAGFGGYALQTFGLVHTTPAKSGFITSLFILFIPFVSRIWERAKIPRNIYIALIPAALGLWLISGIGSSITQINIGDEMTLLSAICYAFQIVAIQIYTSRGDWKWLTILQFACVALFCGAGAIIEKPCIFAWDMRSVAGVLYLAVIGTVAALGVQMFAQRFTTSSRAALVYLTEPLFAAMFAWLFAGMGMTIIEILGGCAILVSIFIGRMREKSSL